MLCQDQRFKSNNPGFGADLAGLEMERCKIQGKLLSQYQIKFYH
jgi:hypothetical protein